MKVRNGKEAMRNVEEQTENIRSEMKKIKLKIFRVQEGKINQIQYEKEEGISCLTTLHQP